MIMNPKKPFCTVKKQTNKQRKLTYVSRFGLLLMMRMTIRYRGTISVSEELRTYPSPNPTLTLTCYHFTVFRLREEQVRSCSDSDIDLIALCQDSQNVCSIDTINHSTQSVLGFEVLSYLQASKARVVPFNTSSDMAAIMSACLAIIRARSTAK